MATVWLHLLPTVGLRALLLGCPALSLGHQGLDFRAWPKATAAVQGFRDLWFFGFRDLRAFWMDPSLRT